MSHELRIKSVEMVLKSRGYTIAANSVEDKNQTRFIHLILKKGDKKYFAKTNIRTAQRVDLENEALGKRIPNGSRFSVVAPIEQLTIDQTHTLFIYPFIAHPAVSSEVKNFNDFTVGKTEEEPFFQAAHEMLKNVSNSSIYSTKDISSSFVDPSTTLLKWLSAIDSEAQDAVVSLQLLVGAADRTKRLAPAIADLQPQNLLWDSSEKHLYLIDLEGMHNMPECYDLAKLAASLHIVCGQSKVATDWLKYVVSDFGDNASDIAQLHTMLLWTGMEYYVYFLRISDFERSKRAIEFLHWSLYEFTELANS